MHTENNSKKPSTSCPSESSSNGQILTVSYHKENPGSETSAGANLQEQRQKFKKHDKNHKNSKLSDNPDLIETIPKSTTIVQGSEVNVGLGAKIKSTKTSTSNSVNSSASERLSSKSAAKTRITTNSNHKPESAANSKSRIYQRTISKTSLNSEGKEKLVTFK